MSAEQEQFNIENEITAIRADLKLLAKLVRRIQAHIDDPTGEKREKRKANNGFNKPLKVSVEMQAFLGLGADELISRSEVTRRITGYVKEKGLKHPTNGRQIVLDQPLRTLLGVEDPNTEITYLNIQKWISKHYVKDAPTA
jgi:upstream activation factor subunit UAF30